MHNAVLSLDGRKEINDNMRPTVNDKGSYDVIMPKFKKLVEKWKKVKSSPSNFLFAYSFANFSYSLKTFSMSSSLNAYGLFSSPTTGSTDVNSNPSSAK